MGVGSWEWEREGDQGEFGIIFFCYLHSGICMYIQVVKSIR